PLTIFLNSSSAASGSAASAHTAQVSVPPRKDSVNRRSLGLGKIQAAPLAPFPAKVFSATGSVIGTRRDWAAQVRTSSGIPRLRTHDAVKKRYVVSAL